MSKFYIMQIVGGEAFSPHQKFRIMETYQTSDGRRSRIIDNSFSTLEEAEEWVEEASR